MSKILKQLDFDTLEERRDQARLNMAYKILNGQVILEDNMLPKMSYKRPSRFCNALKVGVENQLVEPQPRLKVVGKTFFFNVPALWNERVTPEQAKSPSVDSFKAYFQRD